MLGQVSVLVECVPVLHFMKGDFPCKGVARFSLKIVVGWLVDAQENQLERSWCVHVRGVRKVGLRHASFVYSISPSRSVHTRLL